MAFKGMNPEEGREVAQFIMETGQQMLEHIDAATQLVTSVEWIGPDYDSYEGDWNGFIGGAVSQLIELMEAKSKELNQHAEEQDTTSNNG